MVRKNILLVCLTAGLVAAPAYPLGAQGRPATPPGQVNRPPTPTGQTAKPPTPSPGQGAKPATPPGRAGASPAARGPMQPIVVNPKLAALIQPLLPKDTTVASASAGFRNVGAFVAAVHASHNLDIPFTALKTSMVDNTATLGEAIKTLRPTADPVAEAERAEKQAKDMIGKTGGE